MSNRINLNFSNTLDRLAGFPYGKEVYESQVIPKIDLSDYNTIIFPKSIKKVASSFVQGFFSTLVQEIGYQGIKDKITIEASNQELVNDIMDKLF